jgi:hypothetical protein
MTTILKTDAVTEALNKAIETKGEDYVYPKYEVGCTYTDREDGAVAPSCIVGWVIDAIDHEALERVAKYEESEGESFSVPELVDHAGLEFDNDRLADALQAAQSVQDQGAPWAYAKLAYTRVLNEGAWHYEAKEQAMGEWRIEWRRQRDAEEAQG